MRVIYSPCADGYGQHRPCKIVLLTLVTPRGVTGLYISWGINIAHARTAYHKTCGTEYQQAYRRCSSQTPYFNWNIAQARRTRITQLAKLSFNHPSVVLTAHVFEFFINYHTWYDIPDIPGYGHAACTRGWLGELMILLLFLFFILRRSSRNSRLLLLSVQTQTCEPSTLIWFGVMSCYVNI